MEALAYAIADIVIEEPVVIFVNVSVEKPNAISYIEGSGVEVNREKTRGASKLGVSTGPMAIYRS